MNSRNSPGTVSFAARRIHGFMRGEWPLAACLRFAQSLPKGELRSLLADIQAEWGMPDLEGPDPVDRHGPR